MRIRLFANSEQGLASRRPDRDLQSEKAQSSGPPFREVYQIAILEGLGERTEGSVPKMTQSRPSSTDATIRE